MATDVANQPVPPDHIVVPFTVLRDSREQSPWSFRGLTADAKDDYRPLLVPVEWYSLGDHCGDYTLKGMESEETGWRVSIERKSLDDLFSTVMSRREAFVKTLANLNQMEFAAVVVEGDWVQIRTYEAPHWKEMGSDIAGEKAKEWRRKIIVRSIRSWMITYPKVQWCLLPSRPAAEAFGFRLLQRFWKENGG